MKRVHQTIDEILTRLSVLQTEWKDNFSETVIELINMIPDDRKIRIEDLQYLFDKDFKAALTVCQLFLNRSKDELTYICKSIFPKDFPPTKTCYKNDPTRFLKILEKLSITAEINNFVNTPTTWKTLLEERLKGGRGSAIKGQYRGRALEVASERIVRKVFGDNYDERCNFFGSDGRSTAKSDFAIPSKDNPSILIETKAYGATGSKQTDAVGDAKAIIDEKRHDTTFIFVTDGMTWHARKSDLAKLIQLQNEGKIYRIYTSQMEKELFEDLQQLKSELDL